MLDLLAKKYSFCDIYANNNYSSGDIIVAHFDHGTRKNSSEDADFVRRKAGEYGLEFRLGRGQLGARASEAEARKARYKFLREIDPIGTIFTAHHLDDLVETVLINLIRGTGWRGLAGLNRPGIRRPFLEAELFYEPLDKLAIIEYAAKQKLEYREDPSNSWDEYLRNRIRHKTNDIQEGGLSFAQKIALYELWRRQKDLKNEIDESISQCLPKTDETGASLWKRKWIRELDGDEIERKIAREILRAGLIRTGIQATRPQIEDFREAIVHYAPGKAFNLPGDRLIKFSRDEFRLV